MGGKINLVKEKNLYVILVYEDLDKNPKYRFCFSYTDRSEKEALTEAREFSKKMSKNLNLPLEEKI